jgi:hypothetical protein
MLGDAAYAVIAASVLDALEVHKGRIFDGTPAWFGVADKRTSLANKIKGALELKAGSLFGRTLG